MCKTRGASKFWSLRGAGWRVDLVVVSVVLIILCTVLLELREWAEMKALLEARPSKRTRFNVAKPPA
eukprot:1559586-Amphidinium_carterae.1